MDDKGKADAVPACADAALVDTLLASNSADALVRPTPDLTAMLLFAVALPCVCIGAMSVGAAVLLSPMSPLCGSALFDGEVCRCCRGPRSC